MGDLGTLGRGLRGRSAVSAHGGKLRESERKKDGLLLCSLCKLTPQNLSSLFLGLVFFGLVLNFHAKTNDRPLRRQRSFSSSVTQIDPPLRRPAFHFFFRSSIDRTSRARLWSKFICISFQVNSREKTRGRTNQLLFHTVRLGEANYIDLRQFFFTNHPFHFFFRNWRS